MSTASKVIEARHVNTYQITLSRYQVDNLRWMLSLTGYAHRHERVEPFNFLDTGDWVGELYWKLHEAAPDMENDRPNLGLELIRDEVLHWVSVNFKRRFDGRLEKR